MQIESAQTKYAAKVQQLSRITKFLLKKPTKKKRLPFENLFFCIKFPTNLAINLSHVAGALVLPMAG